ncbi:MAG: zinc ribbon domain-containing protein [Fidelibacterota bacterium]
MYDYRCQACGKLFEELVASSAVPDSEIICPGCKTKKSVRLLSAPSIATKSFGNSHPNRACNPKVGFG